MRRNICRILRDIRMEKGITRETLAHGITTQAQVRRIELGEVEAELFLIQALFQRLGASTDMFDNIVTIDEYEVLLIKQNCIIKLSEGKDINEDLKKLETKISKKSPLQRQMYALLLACDRYNKDRDKKAFENDLKQALEITNIYSDSIDIYSRFFCRQEMNLLLLYLYISEDRSVDMERVISSIERHCTTNSELAQVIPKCCYVVANQLIKNGEEKRALNFIEHGEEYIREKGSVVMSLPLMNLKKQCKQSLKMDTEIGDDFIEVLKWLKQTTGQEECVEWELLRECDRGEYLINSELLKSERLQRELTQQELAEGVCETESLSRIENGNRKGNSKVFYQLLEKMDVYEEEYSNLIITNNYHLYESARELQRIMFSQNKEKARELFAQVKDKIDISYPQNEQFVRICEMNLDYIKWNSWEEERNYLYKLLNLTMSTVNGKPARKPRCIESDLLIRIAHFESKNGNKKKAVEIEKCLLEYLIHNTIDSIHEVGVISSLYVNLVAHLEEMNWFDEAFQYAQMGLKYMVRADVGIGIGQLLANFAVLLYRSDNVEMAKTYMRYSYILFANFGKKQFAQNVKDAYVHFFAECIEKEVPCKQSNLHGNV